MGQHPFFWLWIKSEKSSLVALSTGDRGTSSTFYLWWLIGLRVDSGSCGVELMQLILLSELWEQALITVTTRVSRPVGAFCTVEQVLSLRGEERTCSLKRHCSVLTPSFINEHLLDNCHIQGPATGSSDELLVLVFLVDSRHSYTDPPVDKRQTLWTLSPNKKPTTIQVTLWKVLGYRGYNMGWALQC